MIAPGWDDELDQQRRLARGGKELLAGIERDERQRTGISSLKVRYNKVFGYYIEVSRSNLDRVPDDYERRQTLTGAERFVTAELKDLEARILAAEERAVTRERELYQELVDELATQAQRVCRHRRADRPGGRARRVRRPRAPPLATAGRWSRTAPACASSRVATRSWRSSSGTPPSSPTTASSTRTPPRSSS